MAPPSRPRYHPKMSQESSQRLVVAVDDDPRIREALQGLFDSAAIESRIFATSEEALESFKRDDVSCLLTDLHMPGIDGWELQRLTSAAYPQLPIIVISAHRDTQPALRGLKPFAFLAKPFDGEELLSAVHSAFALEASSQSSPA